MPLSVIGSAGEPDSDLDDGSGYPDEGGMPDELTPDEVDNLTPEPAVDADDFVHELVKGGEHSNSGKDKDPKVASEEDAESEDDDEEDDDDDESHDDDEEDQEDD